MNRGPVWNVDSRLFMMARKAAEAADHAETGPEYLTRQGYLRGILAVIDEFELTEQYRTYLGENPEN